MPSTRIILLCIGSAALYGVIHDQVTARICIEYFTVAHEHVIETQSPTLLGLYFGFAATWWVGAILGILLALACRSGSLPRLTALQLIRPIGILLLTRATCALVSGIIGFVLVWRGVVSVGDWASLIPAGSHARFLADAYAHAASYASGLLGGIGVIVWAVRFRRKLEPA